MVEYNIDETIEMDQGVIRTIGMTLGKEILEEIRNQIRIIENKITEVDIEEIIEIITVREVGVGLQKDNFQTY